MSTSNATLEVLKASPTRSGKFARLVPSLAHRQRRSEGPTWYQSVRLIRRTERTTRGGRSVRSLDDLLAEHAIQSSVEQGS